MEYSPSFILHLKWGSVYARPALALRVNRLFFSFSSFSPRWGSFRAKLVCPGLASYNNNLFLFSL